MSNIFEFDGEINPINEFYDDEKVDLNKILDDISNKPKWYLFVGEVQSGKTKKIIDIFKLAYKQNYDYIFVLSGINSSLQDQTIERFKNEEKFYQKYKFLTRIDEYKNDRGYEDDYKIHTFLLIKSGTEMEKMSDLIKKLIELKNPKILIIDDESDYASINTKGYNNPSKTHDHIIIQAFNSIKCCGKGGLISFTATPYAYFLNEKQKDNIDKAIVIKSSPNYKGLDFFNNNKNFYLSIDEIKKETNINEEYQIAILIWLLKTFIYFEENILIKISELLIYEYREKQEHKILHNKINNFIQKLQKNYNFENSNQFNKIAKFLNIKLSLDEFKNWFLSKKINLTILNGENKNQECFNYINKVENLNIIIGGDLLSRGITFKNLITELFIYDTSSCAADTLLQRCRWFGYRENYKYMNVITTDNIIKKLKEAKKYNDIFEFERDDHYIDINLVTEKIQKINNINQILKGTSNAKQ